jgi:hypothetical protein
MLHFPRKPIIVCSAALVTCLLASGSSLGQGKSAGATPPGAGAPAAGAATPSPSPSSELQAGMQSPTGNNGGAVGLDGQTLYSLPLKDAWSLQLGAGVESEQQSRSNPAGEISGRVGLGLKF